MSEFDDDIPKDLLPLKEEALHLESVVLTANRLPDGFEERAVLDLCRVALLATTSPADRRLHLLRFLGDALNALHPTVPRTRDPRTGEYEFASLRTALNALQAEANHLAGKAEAPAPPTPEEPRNDPDSAEADDIEREGAETATVARETRETVNATGSTVVTGDARWTIIVNANVDLTEAAALLAKTGARLDDITSRFFKETGKLLTEWPAHTRRALDAGGFGMELGSDVFVELGLARLAEKTGRLAGLVRRHADRLDEAPERWGRSADGQGMGSPSGDGFPTQEFLQERADALSVALKDGDGPETERISDELRRFCARFAKLPGIALELWDTQVSDVGALSGLTNLQTLNLRGTQVSDVGALSGLTNLQTLDLWDTQVSDVGALSGLTNLQTLDLRGTPVSDVGALSGLTNLQTLNLWGTPVSDVGALSGLTNLQTLDLSDNQVSDVGALSGLTNLQSLDLTSTEVSDVGALSGLTNLQTLDLRGTQVSDVGALSGLTNLQTLNLTSTEVSDVGALSGLTNLQWLDLMDTPVSDVGALSGLTNLQWLDLTDTQVSDVGALAELPNLDHLFLPDGVRDNRRR